MTNEPKTIAGPIGIWACKIGETKAALPAGADAPMRAAVERAYRELTGEQAAFTISGWSAELTEGERAVVENRLPQSPNTAPAELPEALPRYREYLHLRTTGAWSSGVPAWARDYSGCMNDMTAAHAVIEELHAKVEALSAAQAGVQWQCGQQANGFTAAPAAGVVRVCPECDIAGCRHMRAAPPTAQAASAAVAVPSTPSLEQLHEWEAKGELLDRAWNAMVAQEREIVRLGAALAAAPQPPAQAPTSEQAGDTEVLRERDEAEEFIDVLLDEVLGSDRPEWSNVYGRIEALQDVQERITALQAPAVDRAWERFQATVQQTPACLEVGAAGAAPPDARAQAVPSDARLAANTDLLTYVLQDDVHNRLTPRVIDIAYSAFMQAKLPNTEDGGPSDWFNDTKPMVTEAIDKLRRDLMADRAAQKGGA